MNRTQLHCITVIECPLPTAFVVLIVCYTLLRNYKLIKSWNQRTRKQKSKDYHNIVLATGSGNPEIFLTRELNKSMINRDEAHEYQ